MSSTKEAVNNSAQFGKFDSGPVTNYPLYALRRLSPNISHRVGVLNREVTHTQVRTPPRLALYDLRPSSIGSQKLTP